MSIALSNRVVQQPRGNVKLSDVLNSDRPYLLSMHTMTITCSYTEVVSCEKKEPVGNIWRAIFESSNGERHEVVATSGTQVMAMHGWISIESIDWTTVIVDAFCRKAKLVSLDKILPRNGEQFASIITAFNRNVVVDGVVVREAYVDSQLNG